MVTGTQVWKIRSIPSHVPPSQPLSQAIPPLFFTHNSGNEESDSPDEPQDDPSQNCDQVGSKQMTTLMSCIKFYHENQLNRQNFLQQSKSFQNRPFSF